MVCQATKINSVYNPVGGGRRGLVVDRRAELRLTQAGRLLALLSVSALTGCEPLTIESWFLYFGVALVVGLLIGGAFLFFALVAQGKRNREAGRRWGEIAAGLGFRLVPYEEWMSQDANRLRHVLSSPTPGPQSPSLDHAMVSIQDGVIVMAVPLLTRYSYHFRALLETPLGMGMGLQRLCTTQPFGAGDAQQMLQGWGGLRPRVPEHLCGFFVDAEQPERAVPLLRRLAHDLLAAAKTPCPGTTSVRVVVRDHYVEYVVSHFRMDWQEHVAAIPQLLGAAAQLARRVSWAARG